MSKVMKEQKICIIIVVLTILFAWFFQTYLAKEHSQINTDNISYQKGQVVEITKEQVEYSKELNIYLGTQEIVVKLKEGSHANKEVTMTNYITAEHNVKVQVGSKIVVSEDAPKNIAPYYTVYNYDRSFAIGISVLLLFLIIIAIGKGKGVKAIAGLAYSLFLIICVLLPMVFSGYSPILSSIVCGILSTVVTLLLLNGSSEKTYGAILSTVLGVLISLLFFLLISAALHLNGFSVSEAEGLILIGQATGLQIKDVLFAGVLISSLGAIMDVGMSIVSSLYEVHYHNPKLSVSQLFTSGIEIGKDMIGTMSNTLILAFTGSAFITLLVFLSYQVELNQLLNSNYLAIEIAQGICGTIGIVMTVPIASFIAAVILAKPDWLLKYTMSKKSNEIEE